jgi:hypothetical protein
MTGSAEPVRRWRAVISIALLLALFAAGAAYSVHALATYGAEAFDSDLFFVVLSSAGCLAIALIRVGTRYRTIQLFSYDGSVLRIQTLLARKEWQLSIAEIARVEYGADADTVITWKQGWLRLPHVLPNARALAEQLDMDARHLQAAAASEIIVSEFWQTVRRSEDQTPRRSKGEIVATTLLVLAGVFFVSGLYFGGQIQRTAGIEPGYVSQQVGDKYYAVKIRGGPNAPRHEVAAEQHRIWMEGEYQRGRFHLAAISCFLVGWVIVGVTQSRRSFR